MYYTLAYTVMPWSHKTMFFLKCRPRIGFCIFDRHKDRFEDTRQAQNHTRVVQRSIMGDRNVFARTNTARSFPTRRAPKRCTGAPASSPAAHCSRSFAPPPLPPPWHHTIKFDMTGMSRVSRQRRSNNCVRTAPRRSLVTMQAEAGAKHVHQSAPVVGFTKAKRFMTRSVRRMWRVRVFGAKSSAWSREHGHYAQVRPAELPCIRQWRACIFAGADLTH